MGDLSPLLHKELWSKRTSRVIIILMLLCFAIVLLWADWITPMEKKSARLAMAQADKIANPELLSTSTFQAEFDGAMTAVSETKRHAVTLQDGNVAVFVEGYVSDLKFRRTIWAIPDEKMGKGNTAPERIASGHQWKLDELAKASQMHIQARASLESIVGTER